MERVRGEKSMTERYTARRVYRATERKRERESPTECESLQTRASVIEPILGQPCGCDREGVCDRVRRYWLAVYAGSKLNVFSSNCDCVFCPETANGYGVFLR